MKNNVVKIVSGSITITYGIYYYFYFNYIKNNNTDIYKFI